MATYVISDIHGEYDMLMDLLEKMSLQDEDKLNLSKSRKNRIDDSPCFFILLSKNRYTGD